MKIANYALPLLVGVVSLAGCGSHDEPMRRTPTPPNLPSTAVTPLRVMTYNMNFGLAGDSEGIAAISAATPDVVLLQETNRQWETALTAELGARYPHHRFAGPEGRWAAGGMGILSRWPIRHIDKLTRGGGPFFAWRIVIEVDSGPIQILNVHLRPPMSDSGSWVVGYFSTRGDREREARAHLAALDDSLPTLVVGDFNEEDDGLAVAVFRDRGFRSALPQFQPSATTWQWPVGSMTLKFRLDHILADNHFEPLRAEVVQAGRSDHNPLWVDFMVRAPRAD